MPELVSHQALLDLSMVDPRDGVEFAGHDHELPHVTIDHARWKAMGSPGEIVVIVQPSPQRGTRPGNWVAD